jgi:hypothetical protein
MNKTILCAVDITHPEDREVLQTADKLARLDNAQLDVITVVPNFGVTLVSSYFDENFQDQIVNETQKSSPTLSAVSWAKRGTRRSVTLWRRAPSTKRSWSWPNGPTRI